MEDLLIEILESLGYPVIRQGSLSEGEEYPENFFTFWDNDSFGVSYYDNEESAIGYDYDVNFYSTDPNKTYSELRKAKKLLKENSFIVSGDGYGVASDEPTHTGRGMNVVYLNT